MSMPTCQNYKVKISVFYQTTKNCKSNNDDNLAVVREWMKVQMKLK